MNTTRRVLDWRGAVEPCVGVGSEGIRVPVRFLWSCSFPAFLGTGLVSASRNGLLVQGWTLPRATLVRLAGGVILMAAALAFLPWASLAGALLAAAGRWRKIRSLLIRYDSMKAVQSSDATATIVVRLPTGRRWRIRFRARPAPLRHLLGQIPGEADPQGRDGRI